MSEILEYNNDKHRGIDRKNKRWNGDYNYAYDVENGYAYRKPNGLGYVQQRNGTIGANTTIMIGATTKLRALFEANWATGTDVKLCRAGTSWYYLSTTTGAFVAINGASITSSGIAFVDSDPDTITDTGSGFVAAGFVVGQKITVTGTTSNNTSYTIATVVPGTITLVSTDTVTAEGAGASVTIRDANYGARTSDARGQSTTWTDGTNNYIVCVDGQVPIKIKNDYTWSTLSADTNMPQNSTAVHTHHNRLWLNQPGTMKVHGSKILDGTNTTAWTTGGGDKVTLDLQYVLPEYDEPIDFSSYGDSLLVIHCQNYTVIYNAPETFANITWIETIPGGILAGNTARTFNNDLLYPERSALKSLVSYTTVKTSVGNLTDNVQSMYQGYVDSCSNVLDISTVYIKENNHYLITIPNSTASSTQTLVYDPQQKTIVGRYRFKNSSNAYITPYSWLQDQYGDIYFGANDGYLYKFDKDYYSDNGSIIPWVWDSMYLGVDMVSVYKKPFSTEFGISTEIKTGSATTSVAISEAMTLPLRDENTVAQTIVHTITPTTDNPFYFPKMPTKKWKGRDKLFGFRLSHSTLDARVQLTNFNLKVVVQGDK
jgi:hypothetical protein